ncbi:hypothetical protein LZ30DRAFT_309828 [Colletotrichum cereale]|nr:hypothetical protein LZ30DRAFT_309828 [Colletotrichum cereale]
MLLHLLVAMFRFTALCLSGRPHPGFLPAMQCSAVQARNHSNTPPLPSTCPTTTNTTTTTTNSEPRYRAPVPEGFECSLRCHVLVRVKRPASAICMETAGQPGSAAESQTG